MRIERAPATTPDSPLDPYIKQVLDLIGRSEDLPASNLGEACGREFSWLPGFCEVILTTLRTNAMIVVHEWEPGKVHITSRGQNWLAAQDVPHTVTG